VCVGVSQITRVNYNQDVKQMNGLSGAVAIAGSGGGLWAVDGGNEQVPRGLILRSNATVHLGTRISRVDEILDDDTGSPAYVLEDENDKHRVTCDAVVIAAPLEGSGIKFGGSIAATSWDVGRHFQRTVATFIHGTLSTAYFGDDPPAMILTTAHAPAPFSSLARIRAAEGGGFFYKIFSKTHLGKETLNQLFDAGARVVDTHDWLAYPQVGIEVCRHPPCPVSLGVRLV
jgi:prenylcysteine oxidase / farnesylcysteine lyase